VSRRPSIGSPTTRGHNAVSISTEVLMGAHTPSANVSLADDPIPLR
jgi:hypothetical protein